MRSAQNTSSRLVWADAVKGASIVLVVLHHLVSKHYELALPDTMTAVATAWAGVNDVLKPVRMPLFFLISGTFVASSLSRTWSEVARPRVASPFYLYVVWLLLHMVVFSAATTLTMNRTRSLEELALDLLWASTSLWYLYALAVYYLAARLLSGVDRRWVLGGAALLSAAVSWLPIDEVNRVSVLQHLVFFLLGAYAPGLLRRVVALPGRGSTWALAAAYPLVFGLLSWLDAPPSVLVLSAAAVGLPLAARLAAAGETVAPRTTGALATLGRRTLAVYVLHVPVLAALHALVPHLPVPATPAGVLLAALYPLAATSGVIAVCLGLQTAAQRIGLGFLFRLPARRTPRPMAPQAGAGHDLLVATAITRKLS